MPLRCRKPLLLPELTASSLHTQVWSDSARPESAPKSKTLAAPKSPELATLEFNNDNNAIHVFTDGLELKGKWSRSSSSSDGQTGTVGTATPPTRRPQYARGVRWRTNSAYTGPRAGSKRKKPHGASRFWCKTRQPNLHQSPSTVAHHITYKTPSTDIILAQQYSITSVCFLLTFTECQPGRSIRTMEVTHMVCEFSEFYNNHMEPRYLGSDLGQIQRHAPPLPS